ncbi:hypothetical protein EDD85DRAFT_956467 [Armillaria nabsnona]|nr:hypothetical protein EDD85DRAFT_956467 [Armillaria nabsnona]
MFYTSKSISFAFLTRELVLYHKNPHTEQNNTQILKIPILLPSTSSETQRRGDLVAHRGFLPVVANSLTLDPFSAEKINEFKAQSPLNLRGVGNWPENYLDPLCGLANTVTASPTSCSTHPTARPLLRSIGRVGSITEVKDGYGVQRVQFCREVALGNNDVRKAWKDFISCDAEGTGKITAIGLVRPHWKKQTTGKEGRSPSLRRSLGC